MGNRTGNYSAFYVVEPFSESNLGACATPDFNYYHLLKAWKAKDPSFPFNNSHDKTYNVRDNSDWERTLKPRLHQRLDLSKNIILFLSSVTKNSRALREEIEYGINVKSLPIIVVYPDFEVVTESVNGDKCLKQAVIDMWNKLPVLRDNIGKVPTIHVPLNKEQIAKSLNHQWFQVQTSGKPLQYFW